VLGAAAAGTLAEGVWVPLGVGEGGAIWEVPLDSCATADPHFFEFVAARLAQVFGAGG